MITHRPTQRSCWRRPTDSSGLGPRALDLGWPGAIVVASLWLFACGASSGSRPDASDVGGADGHDAAATDPVPGDSSEVCPGVACDDAAAPPPPSCAVVAPGTTDCGPNGGESCCASLSVPGGTYHRSYMNDGTGPTAEADVATVSPYRLDKYLITVGRFRRFVEATAAGWVPAPGSGIHAHLNGGEGLVDSSGAAHEPGWQVGDTLNLRSTVADWQSILACEPVFHTWTDVPASHESLPINCISWYDAYAFCIWDGGFLPSEAEWELAAAGGNEEREYPWGSVAPGTASLYAITGCQYPPGSSGCAGTVNLAPVGTAILGAGRWGQLDLAGNLGEWNLDWYGNYVEPCTDCVYLTDVSYRVVRGGSFAADARNLFSAARDGDVPASRNSFYGARCARSP